MPFACTRRTIVFFESILSIRGWIDEGRGAAVASVGDILDFDGGQLRIWFLLVSVSGWHDSVRDQIDGHYSAGCDHAGRAAGFWDARCSRTLWAQSPALLQCEA